MSKLVDKIAFYHNEMKNLGISCDAKLLEKVTSGLGPTIYQKDSEKVSGSDEKEIATVRKNFLIKKMGCPDSPELDAALAKAVDIMGKSNPNKYRAIFYYLLVKELKLEKKY